MSDKPDLVGSWIGTATASSIPSGTLKNLMTFTSDGSVVETRRLFLAESLSGEIVGTPGHGTWISTGNNEFAATILVLFEGGPNHPTSKGVIMAIEKVRFKLKLNGEGNRLTGTILDEVRDTNGNIIFDAPGNIEASRIPVEPLP